MVQSRVETIHLKDSAMNRIEAREKAKKLGAINYGYLNLTKKRWSTGETIHEPFYCIEYYFDEYGWEVGYFCDVMNSFCEIRRTWSDYFKEHLTPLKSLKVLDDES